MFSLSDATSKASLWHPPDLCGVLEKQGRRTGEWRARFFILKGSNLFWFAHPGAAKPRGHVPLEGASVHALPPPTMNLYTQYMLETDAEGMPVLFGIVLLLDDLYATSVGGRQELMLAAGSADLQGLWLKALQQACIPRPQLLARLHESAALLADSAAAADAQHDMPRGRQQATTRMAADDANAEEPDAQHSRLRFASPQGHRSRSWLDGEGPRRPHSEPGTLDDPGRLSFTFPVAHTTNTNNGSGDGVTGDADNLGADAGAAAAPQTPGHMSRLYDAYGRPVPIPAASPGPALLPPFAWNAGWTPPRRKSPLRIQAERIWRGLRSWLPGGGSGSRGMMHAFPSLHPYSPNMMADGYRMAADAYLSTAPTSPTAHQLVYNSAGQPVGVMPSMFNEPVMPVSTVGPAAGQWWPPSVASVPQPSPGASAVGGVYVNDLVRTWAHHGQSSPSPGPGSPSSMNVNMAVNTRGSTPASAPASPERGAVSAARTPPRNTMVDGTTQPRATDNTAAASGQDSSSAVALHETLAAIAAIQQQVSAASQLLARHAARLAGEGSTDNAGRPSWLVDAVHQLQGSTADVSRMLASLGEVPQHGGTQRVPVSAISTQQLPAFEPPDSVVAPGTPRVSPDSEAAASTRPTGSHRAAPAGSQAVLLAAQQQLEESLRDMRLRDVLEEPGGDGSGVGAEGVHALMNVLDTVKQEVSRLKSGSRSRLGSYASPAVSPDTARLDALISRIGVSSSSATARSTAAGSAALARRYAAASSLSLPLPPVPTHHQMSYYSGEFGALPPEPLPTLDMLPEDADADDVRAGPNVSLHDLHARLAALSSSLSERSARASSNMPAAPPPSRAHQAGSIAASTWADGPPGGPEVRRSAAPPGGLPRASARGGAATSSRPSAYDARVSQKAYSQVPSRRSTMAAERAVQDMYEQHMEALQARISQAPFSHSLAGSHSGAQDDGSLFPPRSRAATGAGGSLPASTVHPVPKMRSGAAPPTNAARASARAYADDLSGPDDGGLSASSRLSGRLAGAPDALVPADAPQAWTGAVHGRRSSVGRSSTGRGPLGSAPIWGPGGGHDWEPPRVSGMRVSSGAGALPASPSTALLDTMLMATHHDAGHASMTPAHRDHETYEGRAYPQPDEEELEGAPQGAYRRESAAFAFRASQAGGGVPLPPFGGERHPTSRWNPQEHDPHDMLPWAEDEQGGSGTALPKRSGSHGIPTVAHDHDRAGNWDLMSRRARYSSIDYC